jgi:TorA maturation chaperone TorD
VESRELQEEDRARADCYALISRLFYAAADEALLRQLASAAPLPDPESAALPQETEGGEDSDATAYADAFRALQHAAREANADAVRQEYDDFFVGAGKALVTPYTSGYVQPHSPDRHLLALRELIAKWGLSRREAVFEVEDHVSALCDVMRWLIERDRPLEEQESFFTDFVYTGLMAFCNAIDANPNACFYRVVARLARAFLTIEKQGFELQGAE